MTAAKATVVACTVEGMQVVDLTQDSDEEQGGQGEGSNCCQGPIRVGGGGKGALGGRGKKQQAQLLPGGSCAVAAKRSFALTGSENNEDNRADAEEGALGGSHRKRPRMRGELLGACISGS